MTEDLCLLVLGLRVEDLAESYGEPARFDGSKRKKFLAVTEPKAFLSLDVTDDAVANTSSFLFSP